MKSSRGEAMMLSETLSICSAPRLSSSSASLSRANRAWSAAVGDASGRRGKDGSSDQKAPSCHPVTFFERIVVTCFVLSPQESLHGASIYKVLYRCRPLYSITGECKNGETKIRQSPCHWCIYYDTFLLSACLSSNLISDPWVPKWNPQFKHFFHFSGFL